MNDKSVANTLYCNAFWFELSESTVIEFIVNVYLYFLLCSTNHQIHCASTVEI
jgi:hypothetical protein